MLTQDVLMKILVLALGNRLRGDDGVGSAVLDCLAETAVFPQNINLIDGGTPGLETALLLQGYDRVIVIDAANLDAKPGTWRRLPLSQISLIQQAKMQGTLHDAGFAEAVALARALGILPSDITLYAVQPEAIEWEMGLSEAVRAVIPQICQQIQVELTDA